MSLIIRCSSLHKIMGDPKGKGELTETAKTYIRELARENLFGVSSFDGNKYTEKGLLMEDTAVKCSGLIRFKTYAKNTERFTDTHITGECDVFDKERNFIIDEKCSWDISTHPFFQSEAKDKAKKSGYDIQMQGYIRGYNASHAEIDFWLLPTPEQLLSAYDDKEKHIDAVNRIPLKSRCTTLIIERDEKIQAKINAKVEAANEYYNELLNELGFLKTG